MGQSKQTIAGLINVSILTAIKTTYLLLQTFTKYFYEVVGTYFAKVDWHIRKSTNQTLRSHQVYNQQLCKLYHCTLILN